MFAGYPLQPIPFNGDVGISFEAMELGQFYLDLNPVMGCGPEI